MTQAGIWSSTGNFFAISRVASIKNKNSLKYAKIPILECFKKHSEQLKLLALLQQFSEDVISFDHSPLKQREGNWNRYLGRAGQLLFGTLRFNDATATRTSTKTIGLIKQNNNFARASHFFVHFFPVFARPRRENT